MSTEYSISVDWSAQENSNKWQNLGQETMRGFYEANPKEAAKDGHDVEDGEVTYLEDVLGSWEPMMNYAYPLQLDPTFRDDGTDRIIKVCRDTSLTVMYNDDEDSYYLALCGGGMDLSQSIALAYQILENWLPVSLLGAVSKQPELAVHGKAWLGMAKQIRRQVRMEIARLRDNNRQWGTNIREYKIIEAKRKANS